MCGQCAHQLPCPKLAQQVQVPCNYPQPFCPLPLPGVRETRLPFTVWLDDQTSWRKLAWMKGLRMTMSECRLGEKALWCCYTEPWTRGGAVQLPGHGPARTGSRERRIGVGPADGAGVAETPPRPLPALLSRRRAEEGHRHPQPPRQVSPPPSPTPVAWDVTWLSSPPLTHFFAASPCLNRDLYRCARNSDYGDRLPVMKPEVETITEWKDPSKEGFRILHRPNKKPEIREKHSSDLCLGIKM